MQRIFGLMVMFFLVFSLFPCLAQDTQENKPIENSSEISANTSETVAILPWIYQNGTSGAHIAAKEFLKTVLTKSLFFREDSFRIIPKEQVTQVWTQDMGHDPSLEKTGLPTPKELLKLGEKLGVDWVVTGNAFWRTRSVWIGLGPKTKSDCIIDMIIVDVKKKEISLDARGVKMDSAPRENPLKVVTVVLFGIVSGKKWLSSTVPLTIVSGGPKTPREQSAVQLAIAKAIAPWLALHPYNKKIDSNDEKEKQ